MSCTVKNSGQRANQYQNFEVADTTNDVTLTLGDTHTYHWASNQSITMPDELAAEAVAASSRLTIVNRS